MITKLYAVGASLLVLAAFHEGGITPGLVVAGTAILVYAMGLIIRRICEEDYDY